MLVAQNPYCYVRLRMDFGEPLRKRNSQIKHDTIYCSEVQSQKLTADKLSYPINSLTSTHNSLIQKQSHFLKIR